MQRHRSAASATRTEEEFFGEVLRSARRAKGLSQEELAFASGYHPTYIGQLERGKKSPSLRAIMTIAKSLEVPASGLLKSVESLMAATKG